MTEERALELLKLTPDDIGVWMEGASLEAVKSAIFEGEIVIRLRTKYEASKKKQRSDAGTKRGPKTATGQESLLS